VPTSASASIFYIYNTTGYARDVELGTLPVSPPYIVRNAPSGTVRRVMLHGMAQRFKHL
jgi:hypothetical protein